jgi:phospholipid/cholesterol/gamma-HCH transport system substrate-binding protein
VVRDTGEVFDALSLRRDALRGLVTNGRRATDALGERAGWLAAAVRAFPAFERESAATVRRLGAFSRDTGPLVTALRPAARALSPALREVGALAPDLRGLLRGVDTASRASARGLPATARFVDDLGGLLREFPPFTRQLNPIIRAIGAFRGELGGLFGGWAASTQATGAGAGGGPLHYLRITTPLNPEGLAQYAQRIGSNRSNPYATEGIAQDLARRFEVFDTRACARGVPVLAATDTDFLQRVWRFALGGEHGTVAPPCLRARPRAAGRYPHVGPDPR